METQTLRRYIVTLKKGVDYDSFYHDMETVTDNIPHIPNRAVAIATWLPHSSRNTFYLLTDAEAYELKNDSRVLEVAIPAEDDPNIIIGHDAIQTSNFKRPQTGTEGGQGNYKNWGLLRSAFRTNIYGSSIFPSTSDYPYHLDGTGVDFVLSDSGIEPDHPEFQDANGVSRVQQINWLKESGVGDDYYTQSSLFYRDINGHGTHVAATTAGKTFGWAKNARIYLMKMDFGQPDYERDGSTFAGFSNLPVSYSFSINLIRLWHINKPLDAVTGKKRPTVVNMSWGNSKLGGVADHKKITRGKYRGVEWNGTDADYDTAYKKFIQVGVKTGWEKTFPDAPFTSDKGMPIRDAALDADVEDLIDAGVIVCIATGNSSTYGTLDPTDPSYDDYVEMPGIYFGDIDLGTTTDVPIAGSTIINATETAKFNRDLTVGEYVYLNATLNPIIPVSYRVVRIISDTNIEVSPGYRSNLVNLSNISGQITTQFVKTVSGVKTTYSTITVSTTYLMVGLKIKKISGSGEFGDGASKIYAIINGTSMIVASVPKTGIAAPAAKVGIITFSYDDYTDPTTGLQISKAVKTYYHRGSTPYADGAIKVSAVDSSTKLVSGFVLEQSAVYSNKGPMTTIWAPGTNITAAWPSGAASTAAAASTIPAYAYNENANYKQRCISGTSMASPQVAGVCALYLQLNPDATPAQVKEFLVKSSPLNMLYDAGVNAAYTDWYSTSGSTNKLLYFPYANSNGIGADVTLEGEGGDIGNLKIAPIAYTYANWASDYKLSNTEKLLGINIANFFYLSTEKLGLQYQRSSWQFEIMIGTITSTAARTTITGINSSSYSNLTPGMVITRNSGVGAFGAGTTTVVSVDGDGQITIQSGALNTAGSINFDTPIPVLYDVYGLNRKPDTAGLEYWTRRCLKTNPAYVNPGDTWTAGDYNSTVFKKTFCDAVFAVASGAERTNFFYPLRYQGGYWTNGDFIDKGIKP